MTRFARTVHALSALLLVSAACARSTARAQEGGWDDASGEELPPADMSFGDDAIGEGGAQYDSAAQAESDATGDAETAEADEAAPDEAALDAEAASSEASEPQRALRLRVAAGLGVGTLSFERPAGAASQSLAETPFAAAELNLHAHVWPKERWSLDVLLAYQSSFGLALQTDPLFGLPENVDVRWQRGEVSFAPVLRLGKSADSLALALPVGFAFQALTTVVEAYTVHGYTIGGPLARVEARLPLGELVRFEAGPELQWIVLLDPTLRREGACCHGFAAGMQASLEARVGPLFRAALAYREAHAFAPAGAWRFKAVERFLTARIAGEL